MADSYNDFNSNIPLQWPEELDNLIAPENAFPYGSNQLGLVENFNQRYKYRYATYFQGLPKPIDTFYDKVFYGKVDRYQNVIVPKKDSALIKQAAYNQNVFVFDFVADAFFQLKRNLKIAGDSGGIETLNTVLYDVNAERGWYNYEPSYLPIVDNFIAAHAQFLGTLENKKVNKIVTIRDYMHSLLDYLKVGAYRRPISLTEYVLSTSTPANVSGLVVETARESYSADLNKYTTYFLDLNFPYYVRAARKFGFYVDKNGPWRLFADVFSNPMAGPDGFMAQAGHISGDIEKGFFNTYYDRTYTLDIPLLKQAILKGFNTFASTNVVITETVPGLSERAARGGHVAPSSLGGAMCGGSTHIGFLGERSQIDATILDNLGNDYWMEFYFMLRMHESGVYYENAASIIEESYKVMSAYDYNQGLIYINNHFKPYLYDERIFKSPLTGPTGPVRVGSVKDYQGPSSGGGTY